MGGAISFLLVGLMIAWFLRGLELDSAQKDLSSAITRNAIAQTQLSQFNDVQTNNVGLAKSTQIVRQALTGDIDQGQLLRQIGSVMPQDVYLRAISINRGEGKKATTIVITAVGRTQTSPGNLVTALRDVPALTGVWIGNSSLDSTAGSGGTRFDVTAQLTSASLSDRVARILGTPK